jgi:hypothetical protein
MDSGIQKKLSAIETSGSATESTLSEAKMMVVVPDRSFFEMKKISFADKTVSKAPMPIWEMTKPIWKATKTIWETNRDIGAF